MFYRGKKSDWAGCKSGELWYRTTKDSDAWKLLANYDEVYSLKAYEDKVLAATQTGVVILDEAGEIERFDADTGLDTTQLKSVVRSPNGAYGLVGQMVWRVSRSITAAWFRFPRGVNLRA